MYLLYGFGKSLRSLAARFEADSIDFVICDDYENVVQTIPARFKALTVAEFMRDPFPITNLVISPGIKQSTLLVEWAKQNHIRVDNDISIFLNQSRRTDHILVTGTFGKSSCVSLVYDACRRLGIDIQLGGNVGTPVFDLDIDRRSILELSAQQLDLCSLPTSSIAILLNLYPQHLDWYDSLEIYYKTKLKILINSQCPIIPLEDLGFIERHASLNTAYKTISTKHKDADFALVGNFLYEDGKQIGLAPKFVSEVSSLGAYSILRTMNLAAPAIMSALTEASNLPHRCEVIYSRRNLLVVNDSKSTNLSNTIYAVGKFAKQSSIVCIIGGKDTPQELMKLDSMSHLVDLFITTGSNGRKLQGHLPNSIHFEQLEDCVTAGLAACKHGGVLLFSPGYPSTDQYRNFEHRGDVFKEIVKRKQLLL